MSEILSQEEIDALLKAGLGGQAKAKETPAYTPFQGADFGETKSKPAEEPEGPKRRTRLRRSSKVEGAVSVHPAVFPSFEAVEAPLDTTNLEIILNLDLEIRVELGNATKNVKEILEMGSGSVIELQKLNGEPVDLLVNNKPFAKGEMIVIGENFGVRVTDILSIPEIIEALH